MVIVLIIQSHDIFEKSLSSVFPFLSTISGYSDSFMPSFDKFLDHHSRNN